MNLVELQMEAQERPTAAEDYFRTMYSRDRDVVASSVRSEEWFKGRHGVSESPHRERNMGWGRRHRFGADCSRVCSQVRVTTYEMCATCITGTHRRKKLLCQGRPLLRKIPRVTTFRSLRNFTDWERWLGNRSYGQFSFKYSQQEWRSFGNEPPPPRPQPASPPLERLSLSQDYDHVQRDKGRVVFHLTRLFDRVIDIRVCRCPSLSVCLPCARKQTLYSRGDLFFFFCPHWRKKRTRRTSRLIQPFLRARYIFVFWDLFSLRHFGEFYRDKRLIVIRLVCYFLHILSLTHSHLYM